MKTLFGRIHFGRLPTEQQRHQSLLKKLDNIMATAKEMADQIDALTERAKADTERLAKIGTESDALLKTIQDLKDAIANSTSVPPEVEAAFGRLSTQYDVLSGTITADDDKVPDAPPPTP